ncbi:MAG: hypothetical protein AB7P43_10945 [Methylocystis sp.]|uniref:hypothetical protein n=2 Tax=Methylocystis sp. TaxID=1911079 RepID=UPI003D0BA4B5
MIKPSTNAARRDREVVKSAARQPVRSDASFPNISSDLRVVGNDGVRALSSGSESCATPYSSHNSLHSSPLSAYTDTDHSSQKPYNDNGQNQNRRGAKTDGRAKVAARVLSIFRKLQAAAGNDQVHAFTLRIDPALLQGVENPTNYMQRRIARELKKRLGRDVPFAGVVEWRTNGDPELHCHGAISLPAHEKQCASDALRAAGGPWRDKQGAARQVDIRPIDPQAKFNGAYGLDGWALYCADDSRQTQLELDRRRSALDPQRQYSRAPRIDMKSGLQIREDYGAVRTTPERKDYSLTCHAAERKDYETVRTTPARKDYIGKDEPLAKTQSLRTKEYRNRLKAERDALRDEVADLRRQLAERTDKPADDTAALEAIEVEAPRIAELQERVEEGEAGCEALTDRIEELGDELIREREKVQHLKALLNNPEVLRRQLERIEKPPAPMPERAEAPPEPQPAPAREPETKKVVEEEKIVEEKIVDDLPATKPVRDLDRKITLEETMALMRESREQRNSTGTQDEELEAILASLDDLIQ